MIIIESKDNTLFKNTKKLKERRYRTKENKYIIEGFRLVQEAFKAQCNIEYLIVNEHGKDKINDYLEELKNEQKITIIYIGNYKRTVDKSYVINNGIVSEVDLWNTLRI